MIKRIITAICAICVMIPVLFLADTMVLPIGISIVSVIAIFELARCMGIHKHLGLLLPIYVCAAALPIMSRLFQNNMFRFARFAFIFGVFFLMYLFVLIICSHGKLPINDCLSFFVLSLYVLLALCAIIYVHDVSANGPYLYILIFLGAWVPDSFAYFTGLLFGKHKLIPDVSPKKTVEGAIGGIVFCVLSYVVYGLILNYGFGLKANLLFLGVSAIFVAIIAQIGDLIMSVIKRHYNVKDYGKFFPGHGGVLDRFDSILAVSIAISAIYMVSKVLGIPLL